MRKLSIFIFLLPFVLLLTSTAAAQGDPTENILLVQRLYQEVYIAGDLDAIDDIVAADFIDHGQRKLSSREDIAHIVTRLHTHLADFRVTVENWYFRDDYVIVRAIYSGVLDEEQVIWSLVDVYRVEEGRIAEAWHTPVDPEALEPSAPQSEPTVQF